MLVTGSARTQDYCIKFNKESEKSGSFVFLRVWYPQIGVGGWKKNLCGKENCHRRSVHYCKLCPDCSNRFRAPYVCNSCEKVGKCTLLKNLYDAEHAQYKSHDTFSSARSGLCTSEEENARLNALISPLVKQGQSLHQLYVTHTDEIMCSEKTLYNYLDAGLFDICSGYLPRKSRLRPRKQKKEYKVDKRCRIGRNYLDFQKFLEENPDTAIIQMDSVIGSVGGKCLLTIRFVESSIMLAFLRDANTSQSVLDILDGLQEKLDMERFQKLRLIYKTGFPALKLASRLQIFALLITNRPFLLQNCISRCNSALQFSAFLYNSTGV